jgi:Acetyltransferase (GNAT) domain
MEDSNIIPRSPAPVELNKVVDFLNKNLRLNVAWPITKEYPTAFTTANLHNMSIITDESADRILSHALLKPFICKTPHAIFKIGAIGSVVTDPSVRHQGLSTKNLENCIAKANEQECDFIILWSDQYEFYRKFGFELAGFEHSFLISQTPPIVSKDFKFMKTTRIDPAAILKLYNQHTVNSVRTVDEVHQYLNIPNSNVFTMWTPQNQLVAYAVEGKGIDLQSYIHEWGGSVPDILDLLSYIIQSEKKPYTFMCPHHSTNLKNRLSLMSDFSNDGFLGMIKINNFDRLATKIKKMFLTEGFDQITLEKKNDEIIFGHKTDLYTLKNEADFVKIVFGPTTIRELGFISVDTSQVLEKVFPLPLWVWGWDSV